MKDINVRLVYKCSFLMKLTCSKKSYLLNKFTMRSAHTLYMCMCVPSVTRVTKQAHNFGTHFNQSSQVPSRSSCLLSDFSPDVRSSMQERMFLSTGQAGVSFRCVHISHLRTMNVYLFCLLGESIPFAWTGDTWFVLKVY